MQVALSGLHIRMSRDRSYGVEADALTVAQGDRGVAEEVNRAGMNSQRALHHLLRLVGQPVRSDRLVAVVQKYAVPGTAQPLVSRTLVQNREQPKHLLGIGS